MPLTRRTVIQDEGVQQGAVNTVNYSGAGVTVAVTGGVATVTIPGGGVGTVTITEVEVDVGTIPVYETHATVVDASVTGTSKIIVTQSGAAPTGRQADENEMDGITANATPGAGSFVLQLNARPGPISGKYKFNYLLG